MTSAPAFVIARFVGNRAEKGRIFEKKAGRIFPSRRRFVRLSGRRKATGTCREKNSKKRSSFYYQPILFFRLSSFSS
jgi:hypothetical protein